MNHCIALFFTLIFLTTGFTQVLHAEGRNLNFVQVRGQFRAQTADQESLALRLKVWDTQQQQYVQQVWQPHAETGEYFMLLAPMTRYVLYIHPQGFRPYTFELNLSEGVFAYTLSQRLQFEELFILGELVGQKVEVLSQEEQYTYFEQFRDSSQLLEQRQGFMADLIERAMSGTNPYSMDRLGYWIWNAPTLPAQPQPEEPYSEYNDMIAHLDETITGKGRTRLDKHLEQRESDLPPPQYLYFHHPADTRTPTTARENTVLSIPLLFPEDKTRMGNAQRQQIRELDRWLNERGLSFQLLLDTPPEEDNAQNTVRARRIVRRFDLPATLRKQPYATFAFPFTQAWCEFRLRVHKPR